MMNYFDLSIPVRSLLILGLFLELCICGCLLPGVFRQKKSAPKMLLLSGMLLSGVFMIIYTAEARARLRDLVVPEISEWLCKQPILLPLFVFLLVLANTVWFAIKEYRFRKNTITRSSIKEGVDKLNSGLCFYQSDGRVVLANKCMTNLCFAIVGRDLQNAELFWEILSGGEVKEDVQRLSNGSRPIFRLPDGNVWAFACEELNGIYQLTAANTTQIQSVTDELKEKNAELAVLNLRLRKHGENVDELTRSRERLETKTRIHSELGQALLSTHRFLLHEQGEQQQLLQMWQSSIAMLRKEAELKEEEQPMDMLTRIASATGIIIERSGNLPSDADVQKLFVQSAAEALTNAVSHAQAKKLFIELEENAQGFTVCFRNDGEAPKGEITEGGGLGSLRKKIESEGGTMTVKAEPEFSLIVTIPKGRGDIL